MSSATLTEQQAQEVGVEAYVYGYPLVTMEMTRRRMTNVAGVDATRAPMGQFAHMREFPTAAYRDVPGANVDTLYSTAWLDVGREPNVLSLPDLRGRYFIMQMLSGWTDNFAAPGSRTTGTTAQAYLVTGPGWQGDIPAGLVELKSPTALVWVIGRTYCDGTPEDLTAVRRLQDQYALMPLSAWPGPYVAPAGAVDPGIDMQTDVAALVTGMDAATYFATLAELLKTNPPTDADAEMLSKLAAIGIVPGASFDPGGLQPAVGRGLDATPKQAQTKVLGYLPEAGQNINGWMIILGAGLYGTDYLLRALLNALGPGWNRPIDAIYPMSLADENGRPYEGVNNYVLRFAKDQLPPVEAFWSLTIYDAKGRFLVPNPLDRYAVGSRSHFTASDDGSIDIYIQHDSPGNAREANWLPTPAGQFALFLRLYWPSPAPPTILDGTWQPPAVMKTH